MKNRRFKVIACNVMWRELAYHAALSPHAFNLQFLDWGLHTEPDRLRQEVQKAIDETGDGFDAILLGYGLCSNGLQGIAARGTRLVIVKGHDCITILLGSRGRYRKYFDEHPGTYWYTPGWIENHLSPGRERHEKTHRHYVEKYGADNAQYLMDMEQDWFRKYTTAAYIDCGVGNMAEYEAYTRDCAAWLKWRFERLEGDAGLIRRLVNGDWDGGDFLIVEPGHVVRASNDEVVLRAVPSEATSGKETNA